MKTMRTDTVVIGGGQAGLAMSEHLSDCDVPHLVHREHGPVLLDQLQDVRPREVGRGDHDHLGISLDRGRSVDPADACMSVRRADRRAMPPSGNARNGLMSSSPMAGWSITSWLIRWIVSTMAA